ncbi:bifunctional DNA primase/polymerase [Microbacterium tenebrionis]|uniref:bifunctional DNA primase/polymerase n=1 Tax=Microbacterium tenebrionis TaxID=2830665 RepID=UPI00158ED224|nr:bifunctional DNA primase/polymerase [Microbacterium ihumii]
MAEVRDARTAQDVIARRASSVAAVFSRLGEGVPLPLVARELARLDVPVFPCAPDGKRPIPERGFHEATTDAGQVEAWWRRQGHQGVDAEVRDRRHPDARPDRLPQRPQA